MKLAWADLGAILGGMQLQVQSFTHEESTCIEPSFINGVLLDHHRPKVSIQHFLRAFLVVDSRFFSLRALQILSPSPRIPASPACLH